MGSNFYTGLLKVDYPTRTTRIVEAMTQYQKALSSEEYAFERKVLTYLLLPAPSVFDLAPSGDRFELEVRESRVLDIIGAAAGIEQRVLAGLLLGFHYYRLGQSKLAHEIIDRLQSLTQDGDLVNLAYRFAEHETIPQGL